VTSALKSATAERIRTLFDAESELPGRALPEALRSQYDGDLRFPVAPKESPYVIANFVSTLDGVVSFNIPGSSGGGPVSGANDGDAFIMGLLRASADAVLVASGTVNAVSPEHVWLPEYIYPAQKAAYHGYRSVRKKAERPLIAIVSGTGMLELDRAVFHTRDLSVVVITTTGGRSHLLRNGIDSLPSTTMRTLPSTEARIAPHAILQLLSEDFGAGLVLTEGGPTLFGEFMTGGLVDELFLTIAPQIAGRNRQHPRPALVEGAEFTPATAPWLTLVSAKRGGDHLYLRYRSGKKEALTK